MPIFGDAFRSAISPLTSPMVTAQYPVAPAATNWNPPAPATGPLAIPPAQPPILLSPPDQTGAAPAQPASALGSLGQGLANGINNHALTLMALGAGIAQGGIGHGLASAASAAQAERSLQAQQANFLQTYQALTGAGVPAEEARAAVVNPSLMHALAVKYLGSRSQSGAPGAAAAPAGASASYARPTPASVANGPAQNPQATNMTPASAMAPALPSNVRAGASYSPTRNMWRDLGGNRFDLQGKTVA